MERAFRGIWMPSEIWLDERLTALDKTILMEIDSLDNDGGCTATNEYLAAFCLCSVTKVSTSISKLIKCGFIEIAGFNGRTRILKSRLSNFERQTFKNCKADFQILKGDNNVENTILDTKKKYIKEKETAVPTFDTLISEYTDDQNLASALSEFCKMRKQMGKSRPFTIHAFELALKKLDRLADTNEKKVFIVETAVEHAWMSFYAPKEEKGAGGSAELSSEDEADMKAIFGEGV